MRLGAAAVATSGALEVTGQPLLRGIHKIALNLATAQSEVKKLR
jgi:hypothetical protein